MNNLNKGQYMHFTQKQLLHYLSDNDIFYKLYTHVPLFTCKQATEIIDQLNIPGIGVKNLFLKDNKKKLYLITAAYNTHIDLKAIANALEAKGLRFADAELLMQHLGVEPGSVTPLALINDKEQAIQTIIDATLLASDYIQVHPLQNSATITITPTDLFRFFSLQNRRYFVYDFINNRITHDFKKNSHV